METKVTLFQLLISGGTILGAIITQWLAMKITVSNMKTKMSCIEEGLKEVKQDKKDLSNKIDSIFKSLARIEVLIEKTSK